MGATKINLGSCGCYVVPADGSANKGKLTWYACSIHLRAPDLAEVLRDILPVFYNESMRTLAKVYAKEIQRAETLLAELD